MRTDRFGETYCQTIGEVASVLEARKLHALEVYVCEIIVDAGTGKAIAEIDTDDESTLVCFLEADTEAEVRRMLVELELEVEA